MNTSQNDKFMKDLIVYLNSHELFEDVVIYVNGHKYSSDYDKSFNPTELEYRGIKYYDWGEWNVRSQLEYCNPDSITMTFEGPLYDLINYDDDTVMDNLNKIGKKYGVYAEPGYAWSLAFYNI